MIWYAVPATYEKWSPLAAALSSVSGSIENSTGPDTVPLWSTDLTISLFGCERTRAYSPWLVPETRHAPGTMSLLKRR